MKIGYVMQLGVDIGKRPFSGQANHVREVIAELSRLGHEVRVILGLDGKIWKTDDLEIFVPLTTPWLDRGPFRLLERAIRRMQSEFKLPYLGLFESMRFALICYQELKSYHLIYERFSWMGYGGSIASRLLKIPYVIEDNGDHLADLEAKGIAPQGLQRRLSLLIMRTAIFQASSVVSTGNGWRRQFIDRWGLESHKVNVIENGTALVRLLRREQLRSFNVEGNPDPVTTLVYVGGFDPWHGIDFLLRALSSAIKAGAQLRLILIGSGFGLESARQLATQLNLSNYVTFTGQLSQSEIAALLAKADIGVSPYCGWKEYSGLKLFDYKAAGLATIASGENGQPVTLQHGHTGWIVPPCDENALTDAIIYLSSAKELRRQMGRAARIEAENCHGWDHTAQQLERVFVAIQP